MNNYYKTLLAILLTYSAIVYSADFQATLDALNRGDYTTALKELRPLAEQGYASAQYNLGVMYYHGEGLAQDYEQAVYWYRYRPSRGMQERSSYWDLCITMVKGYCKTIGKRFIGGGWRPSGHMRVHS